MGLRLRNLRFRQQLVLLFVAGSLLVTLIGSFAASNFASSLMERELRRQGLNIARTLGQNAKLALLYESREAAADAVQSVSGFPDIQVLEIRTASGAVLYRDPGDLAAVQGEPPAAGYLELESPDSWLFRLNVLAEAATPWDPEAEHAEPQAPEILGQVTLALHKRTQQQLATTILFGILGTSSVAAALLLVFLMQASRRITRPLEDLARTMGRAEHGDLAARAELEGGQTDILEMQHAFNAMMDQLESRERELQRARDLAVESARLKGEFAANVTHELRTPMNGVLGLLDLLHDTRLGARQIEYVDLARKSAEGLLTLIDNILDFSKNDSGVIASTTAEVIFRELIEEIINLLGTQALSKGVDIGYFIAPDVPAVPSIDVAKVKQVLINLLGNAIKFTEAGEVFVRVTLDTGTADHLRFEISDTGIGIGPEQRERIFEPFTQADSSPSKRFPGTGLGLTICRQLVEIMGGALGLDSELGRGSTFWFEVPFTAQWRPHPAQREETPVTANVLCVQPSDRLYAFVADTLRREHLGCVHARDLQAARNQLAQRSATGSIPLLIVDDTVYFSHRDEFDEIATWTRVCVLRNPFSALKVVSARVQTLDKPVLFGPLARLAASVSASRPVAPAADTTPRAPASPLRKVLLVEDNAVNQQVAAEMLSRLGVKAELAEHGEQALAMATRTDYDLILMDCNMPVMDGYEATRRIRELEGEGARKVPIIAMTAATGAEEQQRALDAGFTDFLHKPVRLDALNATLARWAAGAVAPPPTAAAASARAEQPAAPYSVQAMQELHDSVGDITYRMVESFLEDTPIYLDSLKAALLDNDARRVYEVAHALKGSASNFGAAPFLQTVTALEALGKAGDLAGSESLVAACGERFAELRKALELYQRSETGQQTGTPHKHQLLIADDDRTLRLAVRGTFAGEEFELIEAADGAQAVALCERSLPDIILMDAMMPDVNGFDACQRIRQLPGGADVPILMVTSLEDEDAIVRAFASGATDYLTKPIHFTVLKERVARMIKANRAELRARTLAFADSLTGLPNRARLNQELGFALSQASLNDERIAILFLDLDNFKNVNDSLGHQVGDLLLKAVADRLRRCVRRSDFIARLGGDEFTVILRRVDTDEVIANIARNILHALSEPFVFIQKRMLVSSSIGIAIFPDHGSDVSTLLKYADLAMFKAKETKNQFCFYSHGMEDEVARKVQLQQELRQALDNDHFVLHLQPQYDLREARAVAAEALVRWQREDGKLLTPAHFVPLAEESGLITELTELVLEKACRQIRAWLDRGLPVKLSVNLSGRDFTTPGHLVGRVRDLTAKYRIPTELLELEITESLLMADPERSREELQELKNAGFGLSIDDFGSGYSSLFYLKNLPVDVLKIDRAFIKDLDDASNRRDIPVITGIIALARSLGLRTVAEGVETESQKVVLESLGCDLIQGYLISEPLPVTEFERRFLPHFATASVPARS
ncbi:MAG: hypothetical protein AMXMBFR26_08230 [Porticoccaceae bacterium]